MIRINIRASQIHIQGHAEYGPEGYDIVCAAVSALAQTLVASLLECTGCSDCLKHYEMSNGELNIEYENGYEDARLLVRSFVLGVRMIADTYPNHVTVIDQELES